MIPLALAGILAIAAIFYLLRPVFGDDGTAAQAAPDSRRDVLEREKEGVYLAIREIEFDHGTGVVSDDDYSRLMARYRAHAVSLLKAIDQLEPEAGTASREASDAPGPDRPEAKEGEAAAVICPACGAENVPGHRFCTRCGQEAPVERVAG